MADATVGNITHAQMVFGHYCENYQSQPPEVRQCLELAEMVLCGDIDHVDVTRNPDIARRLAAAVVVLVAHGGTALAETFGWD